jgi:hyaluronan synthase
VNHIYDIPRVVLRRSPRSVLVLFAGTAFILLLPHHLDILATYQGAALLVKIWTGVFILSVIQLFLSWRDAPVKVTPAQQEQLDHMIVTVNIPVYNEDVQLLDRAIFALFNQTRLPDRVQVVDDGSAIDYSELRDYWVCNHPAQVDFSWVRQENRGKRHAQARTFRADDADIFITLDSDTALERNAIREGMKPFVTESVQSVAGLELAYNQNENWLTRINGLRQLAWQLGACSVQSMIGDVLVNRGTYALYRASLIRDHLDSYLAENFFGANVRFGDDSMLTTYAQRRGKAVQQTSAIQLTMYPENLGHHLRQWTRWMRSSTIRTFWRIRYLPMLSYGWWITVINLWLFFASTIASLAAVVMWPLTHQFILDVAAAPLIWMYLSCARTFIVQRSDQTIADQIDAVALVPLSFLWLLLVLKPLRVWGMATCRRTGWCTRAKVEVGLQPDPEPAGARAVPEPVPHRATFDRPAMATSVSVPALEGASSGVAADDAGA